MSKDKFIITLTAKYPRFEGVTIEEVITQIKEGIEEICGEIFEVEVKKENQTAIIAELEKVRTFITVNNEPTRKMTAITRFINQQIKSLKGDN